MKLRDLLVIINATQPYEIWLNGKKVIEETTDLQRYIDSQGAPEDLVELNLDSEIRKVHTRAFCWKKQNIGKAQLLIDMSEWRTK